MADGSPRIVCSHLVKLNSNSKESQQINANVSIWRD